jgi:hypothetical protein
MHILSEHAKVVLTLMSAQRYLWSRCDGSWWLLDSVKWEVFQQLSGPERGFILALIDEQNMKRADLYALVFAA